MTGLWRICFSALLVAAGVASGATVAGRLELKESKDPAVAKRRDYSGVVVWLEPAKRNGTASATGKHVRMLQKDKTFIPHVLPVETGTIVDFPNADPIFHNAFSNYNGEVFDVGLYPPKTSRSVAFKRPGVVRVFCNIHASMSAVIVVVPTSYFTTTKADGSFEIADVAPGDYTVKYFHERATPAVLDGLQKKVTVDVGPMALGTTVISESGYLPMPHKNKYGHDYPVEGGAYSGKQ